MEAYTNFAQVYDTFMDNVPYIEWSGYIRSLLLEYGILDGIILDLGCGTGNLTALLAEEGYDMIGVDCSEDMLMAARQKMSESDLDILYLEQDMRELELFGTVKAVISVCDCMNYIMEESELLQVFKLVNNYLDPEGYFIFDLNMPYKYKEVLADNIFAENREECSFIWDNTYYEEERVNEYDLSVFVRVKNDLYSKFTETHYQKSYEIDRIQYLLKEAGLEFIAVYDAFTKEPPRADSERVYFIAKENGKLK